MFVEAQVALIYARMRLLVAPRGSLLRAAAPLASREASESDVQLAHMLDLAIARVARRGVIRAACLPRALALEWMLRRRGIHGARICLGAAMMGGVFSAHAWVELGGTALDGASRERENFERLNPDGAQDLQ
jgi:hypothetical protein